MAHDPGDESADLDKTPIDRPMLCPTTASDPVVVRLLSAAESCARIAHYCTSLAREKAAGRIPAWEAERSKREADLERHYHALRYVLTEKLP